MTGKSTFGVPQHLWDAAKQEAKDAMVARARVRGMIPYSDLVREIHSVAFEAHDRRLDHLLGEISDEENAAGRGMLTVVVVHKLGDMEPGRGFYELARQLGRNTNDRLRCWSEELKLVYRTWSVGAEA